MLDLNVLLDVVQKREPFYAASATVLSQAVEEPGTSCLPGHALTALHYIVAKYVGREQANTLVDWVLAHLEIVPQDRAQFVRARNLRFDDFENAALASAAEAAGCKRDPHAKCGGLRRLAGAGRHSGRVPPHGVSGVGDFLRRACLHGTAEVPERLRSRNLSLPSATVWAIISAPWTPAPSPPARSPSV